MAKVVILGGGVGGLSAAHELVERGFEVAVYEQRNTWGGKARGYGVPGTGVGGRKDLPAEHGFRLFPGFYKHLPDTMKRIPYANNPRGVFDNLVPTKQVQIAREAMPPLLSGARFPRSIEEWIATLQSFFQSDLGIPAEEGRLFVRKLLTILTSCQERRLAEYEGLPWWTFIEADGKSEAYRKLLGEGLMRWMFAMPGKQASTRTIGGAIIQIMFDELAPMRGPLRVLAGPQAEVWIDPWVAYLQGQGVELYPNTSFRRLNLEGGRIRSATVAAAGREREVEAEYYIGAVPVEVMRRLLTAEVQAAAPSLSRLDQLQTRWKLGIQFYLKQDLPVVRGYVMYADSPWSLISLSSRQFWPRVRLSEYGNGEVRGILSVEIANWDTPGSKVVRKPAEQCSADEICAEVWAQLKAHLNAEGRGPLEDDNLIAWHIDPDLRFPRTLPQEERNVEPLLINTAGSWQARPEAHTEIPNLFLAADYVRTYTDGTSMEGANEAARRAVNGILKASGGRAQPCELWPLEEPALFAPARAADYVRFKLGYGHDYSLLEPVMRYLPSPRRLSPATRWQDLRDLNRYRFQQHWSFSAPPEEIWKLVADPGSYPEWWQQYPKVVRLNNVDGVGASWEMHIQFRTGLPYKLTFVIDMVRCDEPHLVEWRARGDLNGRMAFTIEPAGSVTGVTYDSDLHTGKLVLNTLAPVAKPLFIWNHERMMRYGEQELRAELIRRGALSVPSQSRP